MTWLNAMNDQGIGLGSKIVSGTIRDSLHMVDVIFGLDGGDLPEIVASDTGSYGDLVFGLLELLGISYRPALADLPDQKGWRISAGADYGPPSPGGRSICGRSASTGATSCGWSPPSTPARSVPTTW